MMPMTLACRFCRRRLKFFNISLCEICEQKKWDPLGEENEYMTVDNEAFHDLKTIFYQPFPLWG